MRKINPSTPCHVARSKPISINPSIFWDIPQGMFITDIRGLNYTATGAWNIAKNARLSSRYYALPLLDETNFKASLLRNKVFDLKEKNLQCQTGAERNYPHSKGPKGWLPHSRNREVH
jgi:hypothetical protein